MKSRKNLKASKNQYQDLKIRRLIPDFNANWPSKITDQDPLLFYLVLNVIYMMYRQKKEEAEWDSIL